MTVVIESHVLMNKRYQSLIFLQLVIADNIFNGFAVSQLSKKWEKVRRWELWHTRVKMAKIAPIATRNWD